MWDLWSIDDDKNYEVPFMEKSNMDWNELEFFIPII